MSLKIWPQQYILVKDTLIRECLNNGNHMTRQFAHTLVKLGLKKQTNTKQNTKRSQNKANTNTNTNTINSRTRKNRSNLHTFGTKWMD